jgi:hypothetical protein
MPIDMPRISARVSYKELGTIYHLQILQRAKPDTLNTAINARNIYSAAKYPHYLHIGIVIKDILRKVARITPILFVVICPAYNPATLHPNATSDKHRHCITKEFGYSG